MGESQFIVLDTHLESFLSLNLNLAGVWTGHYSLEESKNETKDTRKSERAYSVQEPVL